VVVGVRNRMLFAIDLNLGEGMLVFGFELVVCIAIVVVIEVSTGIGTGIEKEGI